MPLSRWDPSRVVGVGIRGNAGVASVAGILCCLAVTFAGCSSQPLLDPASPSSFFDLRTINDTSATVSLQACTDVHCRDRPFGVTDVASPGSSVDQGYWNDVAAGGVAAVRISRGVSVVGCVGVRFVRGQRRAVVFVSRAHPC